MVTFRHISGTNTKVVVSSRPLCPPASKPSATTASTPAAWALSANLLLLTTCTTFIPFSWSFSVQRAGLPAEVKTTETPSSIMTSMVWALLAYIIGTFTPKGLLVCALHCLIWVRNSSADIEPEPSSPNPPALLTAVTNCHWLAHIIPPWMIGCSIPNKVVILVFNC